MGERLCRYCGEPLPKNAPASLIYCCPQHRRNYQSERRREERAEARALREAESGAWLDPWSRNDLDDWSAEEIYGNALLDPLPVDAGDEAVAGSMASCRPKKRASWKERWLSLV